MHPQINSTEGNALGVGAVDELWHELLDCVAEVKDDTKGNRRMLRHVRSLESVVAEISRALTGLAEAKKKRW